MPCGYAMYLGCYLSTEHILYFNLSSEVWFVAAGCVVGEIRGQTRLWCRQKRPLRGALGFWPAQWRTGHFELCKRYYSIAEVSIHRKRSHLCQSNTYIES